MTSSFILVLALFAGWVTALRRAGRHDLITSTPYNNQHSDASAARDERSLTLG